MWNSHIIHRIAKPQKFPIQVGVAKQMSDTVFCPNTLVGPSTLHIGSLGESTEGSVPIPHKARKFIAYNYNTATIMIEIKFQGTRNDYAETRRGDRLTITLFLYTLLFGI